MKLINLLLPRRSQLILTPYSSLVKVSFYLVSAIGKLKFGKKLPNFGFVTNIRSSRPEVFCKKGVLRNFAKFTGTHLCQSLFFNKVAGPRPKIKLDYSDIIDMYARRNPRRMLFINPLGNKQLIIVTFLLY